MAHHVREDDVGCRDLSGSHLSISSVLRLTFCQVFMAGIFLLQKSFILASLTAPLIAFTIYWTWTTDLMFGPLSHFVGLSSVCEVSGVWMDG